MVNCSAHGVKMGKRCTNPTAHGSFEKSFVWIVDKYHGNIRPKNKQKNCLKNS